MMTQKTKKPLYSLRKYHFGLGTAILGLALVTTGVIDFGQTNSVVYGEAIVDNVTDLGGGVNITPLKTEVITNDNNEQFVRAHFEVSVAGVHSSDDSMRADTYEISTPGFARDVNISIIGAYSDGQLNNATGEFDPNDIDAVANNITTAEEAEAAGNYTDNYTPVTYEQAVPVTLSEEATSFEVSADTLNAFTAANNTILPLYGRELTVDEKPYRNNRYVGSFTPLDIRAYEVTINALNIVGLHIYYDVPIAKAEEVGYLPLLVHNKYYYYLLDVGEDLRSYRKVSNIADMYKYIENPQKIKEGDYDEHGLYGNVGTAVTRNMSSWEKIGRDLEPASFEFAEAFNLRLNPAVSYLSPTREDLSDIAVLRYIPSVVSEWVGDPYVDRVEEALVDETWVEEPATDPEVISEWVDEKPAPQPQSNTDGKKIPPHIQLGNKKAQAKAENAYVTKAAVLPETGDTPTAHFAIAGLALMGLGLAVNRRKKHF
ncbi:LPXTG cell wall anchor domain-containing protein [Streptococcus pluranimalium]|uniref:Gram-positive cocci surface proteins LPxTG domain-containing protein n=1 Tax=Streptococcus pluranimalium TaxID=82348 RepID=A0A345VML8_9STRE|nr:LPXTG cell wall anchor domain-containing protein [Streptococcus pluranimalium]AXJ13970.1 hypothetical protein Sp14A_20860 [Streptococcus pluranimalium]